MLIAETMRVTYGYNNTALFTWKV